MGKVDVFMGLEKQHSNMWIVCFWIEVKYHLGIEGAANRNLDLREGGTRIPPIYYGYPNLYFKRH